MALNKEEFASDLKGVFTETQNSNGNEKDALDNFVNQLSEVFVKHMKTIEIVYTSGLRAPNGEVTGKINHTVE